MTIDDRELLGEPRRLSRALGPFADGIFADSLPVAEQRDFGNQLVKIAACIRERVRQKPLDNSSRADGDTP